MIAVGPGTIVTTTIVRCQRAPDVRDRWMEGRDGHVQAAAAGDDYAA
jgi:hypothetical protein